MSHAHTLDMATLLGSAHFGVTTFCASLHGADECDSRGLPLTPNSVNITGRFRKLLSLSHPSLATYLDIKSSRNERLILVTEWYDDNVENHIKSGEFVKLRPLSKLACQVLEGLVYLSTHNMVNRSLSPDNILLTPQKDVKLHNYGLYHITDHGKEVDFPIGSPRYMAPEIISAGPKSQLPSSAKVDVWALGIIMLELFMECPIYPDLFLRNAISALFKRVILLVQNYQRKGVNPLTALLETHSCTDKPMDEKLRSFLEACLIPLPTKRPSPDELLKHAFITSYKHPAIKANGYTFLSSPFSSLLRCSPLSVPSMDDQPVGNGSVPPNHLVERPMRDVYYLWSLAGGDLEGELKKRSLIQTKPSILTLPKLMVCEGETYGATRDRVTLFDSSVIPLPFEQLYKRLENLTTEDYYPLMESATGVEEGQSSSQAQRFPLHESAKLPLAIKEKDVEYQFHRLVLFSRLLESYPFSRSRIVSEALLDICPLLRGEIWAAVLGVKGDILSEYADIDKDSLTATDRQIDVDIPRCHQYDPLLSSSEGHKKFKRVLKSWIISHSHLVYWQGLDSLCAPFLALNFNNEALACACMGVFIDKYLYKFFLKDNSAVMQEYLAIFGQLIAFHDPELFNHLDSICFQPELYAIPWFLTMYSHILPLSKIYHLWDTLLMGNSSFPLCVGVAIMAQLRGDLLSFGFNECILMFSDMTDIDIQQCINDAVRIYQTTPPSVCVRCHEPFPTQDPSIPITARRGSLPLATLKSESCPQISAHDLIKLCHLESQALSYDNLPKSSDSDLFRKKGGVRGPKKSRQKAVVVDIRTTEDFRLGHVPNSISIPETSAFQPDGSLRPSQAVIALGMIPKGHVIIVMGGKKENVAVFARQLVRMNHSKVCVLSGGAGVLRTLGLLSSLHDDP